MNGVHLSLAFTVTLTPGASLQEGNRFNKEGEIVVTSTRTRSQAYALQCRCQAPQPQPSCLGFTLNPKGPLELYKYLDPSSWVGTCRDNVEDAIEKLQSFIDAAALAVQPIEEDPVKKKKIAKQCAPTT